MPLMIARHYVREIQLYASAFLLYMTAFVVELVHYTALQRAVTGNPSSDDGDVPSVCSSSLAKVELVRVDAFGMPASPAETCACATFVEMWHFQFCSGLHCTERAAFRFSFELLRNHFLACLGHYAPVPFRTFLVAAHARRACL